MLRGQEDDSRRGGELRRAVQQPYEKRADCARARDDSAPGESGKNDRAFLYVPPLFLTNCFFFGN